MRKYILIGLLLALPCGVWAQSKAETSQFQKIEKKPAVKAADKFLRKFPSSVYAPRVLRLRDSLLFYALDPEDAAAVASFAAQHPDSPFIGLASERILRHNTSLISHDEALRVAGDCLDAVGWRKDNVEHVLALGADFCLRVLSPAGQLETSHVIPPYTLADLPFSALVLPLEVVAPFGTRTYLHFGYRNGDSEYVEVLYLPEEDMVHQALFYGKALPGGRIEGQSPEMMEGLTPTAEVAWLSARFADNTALVPLSKADYLSDAAIRWWQEKNPRAETSAAKLSFGKLDPACSLVAAYKKAAKEKGRSYTVAKVNLRGYTAICGQSRASGDYLLIWCEPVRKGRELRTFYFESDETTLDLVYYQAKTTFKYKISLATQAIRRLK